MALETIESLETRLVLYAATGNAWPTSQIVTISFQPDGTNLGGVSSDLFKEFNSNPNLSGRWQTFRRLEYPSTLPYVLAGMEVGIVFAVVGAVVGEYLGGDQGLGYRIVTSLNNLEAETLFAVILVLTLFGFLLYLAVVVLKRFLIPWHDSTIDSTRAST